MFVVSRKLPKWWFWLFLFSSPCQRQSELLSSLGIRRALTFHILIFSSETPQAGSIYGRFSIKIAHLSWSINKHGHHRQLLFLIGWFLKIFHSETAWPNGPKHGRKHLWELLIPFWTVNKHGRHKQFLFLIGRFLKQLFLWNRLAKWTETW